MKKGFMKWVRDYMQVCPGLTAEKYAQDGYHEGYVETDAENQEFSLASTLMKQVRDGKESHIRRERIGRKLYYFPVKGIRTKTSIENISFQISLSEQEWRSIDNLITDDGFRNRNQVIEWLAKRCISAGVGLSPSLT